jgi:uncharacterized protein (TIGR04222 family)
MLYLILIEYIGLGLLLALVGSATILPAIIIASVARKRAEIYMKQRKDTVIAQYDPPLGLSPAEIGYLYDLKCDDTEVRATLFSLERRGAIKIIDEKNIAVVVDDSKTKLNDYEKIAIDLTYRNKESNATLADFCRAVGASLTVKGYVIKNGTDEKVKRIMLFYCLVIAVLALGATISQIPESKGNVIYLVSTIFSSTIVVVYIFWPFILFAGYLLYKLWSKIVGNYWLGPKALRQLWPELEGYRMFIMQTDLDNIQFDSKNNESERLTWESLPYVLAFNAKTGWNDYFKNNLM